jgi:ABC-type Fe3+ transport system permease subunit
MNRRSCSMMASSLLLTNVESRKRGLSSQRLMSDSGAAHANWVNQGKEVSVCWAAYVSVLCVVNGRTVLAVWINIAVSGRKLIHLHHNEKGILRCKILRR